MGSLQTAILIGAGYNMNKEHETGLVQQCFRRVAEFGTECDANLAAPVILFGDRSHMCPRVNLRLPGDYKLTQPNLGQGANLLAGVHAALGTRALEERLLIMAISDCHDIQGLDQVEEIMGLTPEAFLLLVHTSCDNSGLLTAREVSMESRDNMRLVYYTDGRGRNVGESLHIHARPLIQRWRATGSATAA